MTTAEIITIGTELLLGEIQDKNTAYLARQLRELGIDLFRVTTIGDNTLRIADAIRESLSRADVIITTGGLGPTIDDPTRNAVSIAVNSEVVFHPELWRKITRRFHQRGITPSENNRKQAYLPESALAIDNPVGTAPAFYLINQGKMIISLPGVPAEMETIFQVSLIPLLKRHFTLQETIQTRVLHTSGVGESLIDELIGDLEALQNPTVGLSAHPASVDIRITAKSANEFDTARMIAIVESDIRNRLSEAIYGVDGDTLPQVINELLTEKEIHPEINLFGLSSGIISSLSKTGLIHFKQLDEPFTIANMPPVNEPIVRLALNLTHEGDLAKLEMFYIKDDKYDIKVSTYNGPPSQTEFWQTNTFLDFIWRKLRTL